MPDAPDKTMSTLEFLAASVFVEATQGFTLDTPEFFSALEILSDPDWRDWLGKSHDPEKFLAKAIERYLLLHKEKHGDRVKVTLEKIDA